MPALRAEGAFGLIFLNTRRSYLVALISLALVVPLVFGTIRNLPIILPWFLAPLILLSFLRTIKSPLNIAFLVTATGGLISIVVANLVGPQHGFELHTFFANGTELLLWTLFAPSFLFLARSMVAKSGLESVALWLAIWSSVFLIVITVPLLLLGGPVRATNPDGTVFLNVSFFGIPIFATYGVNSLAPLFCLQAAVICAVVCKVTGKLLILFAAGLVCAVFLIVGSENRATQLNLVLLIFMTTWYIFRWRLSWRRSALVAFALCAAFLMAALRGTGEVRLFTSIKDVSETIHADVAGHTDTGAKKYIDENAKSIDGDVTAKSIDDVSTGRLTIWRYSFNEWLESPIIGNGFSTFGRYRTYKIPKSVTENTTAHLYYLNVLWKGGIIFFVPLIVLIAISFRYAWVNRMLGSSTERYFFFCAVLGAFTFQSLIWDFLILPSGGALAWFLLGAITVGNVDGEGACPLHRSPSNRT